MRNVNDIFDNEHGVDNEHEAVNNNDRAPVNHNNRHFRPLLVRQFGVDGRDHQNAEVDAENQNNHQP